MIFSSLAVFCHGYIVHFEVRFSTMYDFNFVDTTFIKTSDKLVEIFQEKTKKKGFLLGSELRIPKLLYVIHLSLFQ